MALATGFGRLCLRDVARAVRSSSYLTRRAVQATYEYAMDDVVTYKRCEGLPSFSAIIRAIMGMIICSIARMSKVGLNTCREPTTPNEDRNSSTRLAAPLIEPIGNTRTFYKRQLPCPPAVAFSSTEGAKHCPCPFCETCLSSIPPEYARQQTWTETALARPLHASKFQAFLRMCTQSGVHLKSSLMSSLHVRSLQCLVWWPVGLDIFHGKTQ